jgi:O-antigen/teichoic acid export membrane protein
MYERRDGCNMKCFVVIKKLSAMKSPMINLIFVRGSTIVLQSTLALGMGWLCKPADFGQFVTIVAYAMVFSTFCSGGAYQAALRVSHLLSSTSTWRSAMMKHLLRSVMRRALVGSTLTVILLATKKDISFFDAAIGGLLTTTASIASIASGITMARGSSMRYQISELLIRLPVQILGVAAFIFADKVNGFTLVLCNVIASICGAGYLLVLLPIDHNCSRKIPERMGRLVGKFLTSASINATLFSLFSACDILFGSRILSNSAIAPIGIANRISSSVAMINGAIFDLQSSKIALAVRRQNHVELKRLARLVAMESVALTALTAIMVAIACVVMYSNLPATYLNALFPLAILMAGRLIQACLGPGPAVMTLRSRHVPLALIVGTAIAVEVAIIYWLAPTMSAVGLSIASALGLIFYSVAVHVYIKRTSRSYIIAQL